MLRFSEPSLEGESAFIFGHYDYFEMYLEGKPGLQERIIFRVSIIAASLEIKLPWWLENISVMSPDSDLIIESSNEELCNDSLPCAGQPLATVDAENITEMRPIDGPLDNSNRYCNRSADGKKPGGWIKENRHILMRDNEISFSCNSTSTLAKLEKSALPEQNGIPEPTVSESFRKKNLSALVKQMLITKMKGQLKISFEFRQFWGPYNSYSGLTCQFSEKRMS
ncbi:hypothetical protein MJT46_001697 [Ovis ammon polii x Ovis aries]|nr:hypothetical protein MJT46_001697 [Ovis ammon polii x Ovis aries]